MLCAGHFLAAGPTSRVVLRFRSIPERGDRHGAEPPMEKVASSDGNPIC